MLYSIDINMDMTDIFLIGVFADSKKIPAGTFVGIYAGELLRDSVGEERGMLVYVFSLDYLANPPLHRKYNAFGKTYLFDIDLYYLKDEDPDWQVSYTVDAYHAGNVGFLFPPETS